MHDLDLESWNWKEPKSHNLKEAWRSLSPRHNLECPDAQKSNSTLLPELCLNGTADSDAASTSANSVSSFNHQLSRRPWIIVTAVHSPLLTDGTNKGWRIKCLPFNQWKITTSSWEAVTRWRGCMIQESIINGRDVFSWSRCCWQFTMLTSCTSTQERNQNN